MEDYESWVQILNTVDPAIYLEALQNGFPYIQSILDRGILPEPFVAHTRNFCQVVLKNIIMKLFEIAPSYENYNQNEILTFFYQAIVQISLQRVTTDHSDFNLLAYLFSYPDDYSQNNPNFIDYLFRLFMYSTQDFNRVLEEFTSGSFPSFEEYTALFLILTKISQFVENTFLENCIDVIIPSFYNFLAAQTPDSLNSLSLDVLIPFANQFLAVIVPFVNNDDELFPFYNFLKTSLSCTVLDKKLFAAHYFQNAHDAIGEQGQRAMYEYLYTNNFFDELFRTKPHIELVNIFSPLICSMAENQLISIEIIWNIWQQSVTANSTDRIIYFKLIINILPFEPDAFLSDFFGTSLATLSNPTAILEFYKMVVAELIDKDDRLFNIAIQELLYRCDRSQFMKTILEFISLNNEKILNGIKSNVDGWITGKLIHSHAYEIIDALINNKNVHSTFDYRPFIEYIIEAQQSDRAHSRNLFKLLFDYINGSEEVQIEDQDYGRLYYNSDRKYFWDFMLSLLKQKGLSFSQNHQELIGFFIQNEDVQNVTKEYVDFILLYYIQFSTIEDKSIVDLGNNTYQLVQLNENLSYLFHLCGSTQNNLCAVTLKKFLTSLLTTSKMPLSVTVSYIIEQILAFQSQNPDSQSPQVYELLLEFVDSVEARFDISIFNKKRIKDSKKLFPISVNQPNSENQVEIRITPKTTVPILTNILSALFRVPIESISINADSFKNVINSKSKTAQPVRIAYQRDLDAGDIFDPETFPCFGLSTIESTEYFIGLLQNRLLAPVAYKLLSRFAYIRSDSDRPDFFMRIFNDKQMNSPYYFKYSANRFYYILKNSPELIPQDALKIILNMLYDAVVERRFESRFLIPALIILNEYYKENLFPVNVAAIINQAIPNPKYLIYYMKTALTLLQTGDGLVLNTDILMELTRLSTSLEIYQIFDQILSRVTSETSLMALLVSIIDNPIGFVKSINFIENIFYKILKKLPTIIPEITQAAIRSIETKTAASIPLLCKVLKAATKPDLNNPADLKSLIRNLITRHAFSTSDESVQSAIFDMANSYPDEARDAEIVPMLQVPILNFDQYLFKKQIVGMSGLQNLGCTCYMNSVLQQLAAINAVLTTLAEAAADPNVEIRPDINQLFDLFANMKFTVDGTNTTRDYCDLYQNYNPEFRPGFQEDANEYYITILDAFPEATKRLFQSKFKETIQRADNQRVLNEHEELYTTVSVTVANITDLGSSLKQFLAPESLSGDNAYSIGGGQKVDALKSTSFNTIPRFLVFQLKRFEYNLTDFTRYKVDSRFEFPTTLNMSEYSDIDRLYRLKGAVIHMGVAEGGHYISVVKHNSKWVKCDDRSLTEIDEAHFFDIAFGGKGNCSAYLLFYEQDGDDNPISDNRLFQMIPEAMRHRIDEYNQTITRCSSLYTNASFNYFLHKLPSDVSINYFFKSLCHSRNRNKLAKFGAAIENCGRFIIDSTNSILDVLEQIPDPEGTRIIVDVISNSLDVPCIRAFMNLFDQLLSIIVLIDKFGLIFQSAAKKGKMNEEAFTILRDEIIPAICNNTKIGLNLIKIHCYFNALAYAPPTFSIEPLLTLIQKFVDVQESPLLSFIYLFTSREFDMNSLIVPEAPHWVPYLSIAKLLSSKSIDVANRILQNSNEEMLNILIQLSKGEFLNNCLQQKPEITIAFLLSNDHYLRSLAEKIIISSFGYTNNHDNPAYENSKPSKNEKSQAYFNSLVQYLGIISDNEERNSILQERDYDPFLLQEYFRTLIWFVSNGTKCELSEELIRSMEKLVVIQGNKGIQLNVILVLISLFISYIQSKACFYLIPFTLQKFVVSVEADQNQIDRLSYVIENYQMILNLMYKQDREIVNEILSLEQFVDLISFIKGLDYPNIKPLKDFLIFVKKVLKNLQGQFEQLDEVADSIKL